MPSAEPADRAAGGGVLDHILHQGALNSRADLRQPTTVPMTKLSEQSATCSSIEMAAPVKVAVRAIQLARCGNQRARTS